MNYELEQNYANEYAKERKRDHNYLFICLHFILVCAFLKTRSGASLVAQWFRVRLPMQGTWVRALVWEDPTCRRATGPVSHNY